MPARTAEKTMKTNTKTRSPYADPTRDLAQISEGEDGNENEVEEVSPATPSDITTADAAANGLDTKEGENGAPTASAKKKKKKKTKKKSGNENANANANGKVTTEEGGAAKPVGLCIARNKHWKYISSYHGPWLQLPVELLESLLILNLDPATLEEPPLSLLSPSSPASSASYTQAQIPPATSFARLREYSSPSISLGGVNANANGAGGRGNSNHSPPLTPPTSTSMSSSPGPTWSSPPGSAIPPAIDPGVFRSVATIRRRVDEAAELAVRTASAHVSFGGGGGAGGGAGAGGWATAHAFPELGYGMMGYGGIGGGGAGAGGGGGGGRNVPMSATRIHRLRALAVQKLAEAYKADEIAASVMVMQKGTVFDDVAERVLRVDPKNADARYVHFFHEKIPSRQLAESTPTTVLDNLIAEYPQHLEYYRTRGVAHCFKNEFALAAKDFTYALKESRILRRSQHAHDTAKLSPNGDAQPKAKRKKNKLNGRAPANGTAPMIEGFDGEPLLLHPSVLPDAPAPLEPQLIFHRAAAHLSHALFLVEEALYAVEGITQIAPDEVGNVFLSYIPHGRYGGTEVGNPDGPLGASEGPKARAYRAAFTEAELNGQVNGLLRKSMRDYEKFLAHFDILEGPLDPEGEGDAYQQVQLAFALLDTMQSSMLSSRPADGKAAALPSDGPSLSEIPITYSTYHPLMLEAHFSLLLCMFVLGDFAALTEQLFRAARTIAGLEGYPVFLPPRSVAQAKFVEVLERLAAGWRVGKMPHALVRVERASSATAAAVRKARAEKRRPQIERSPTGSDEDVLLASAASSSAGPSSSRTPARSTSRRGSPTSDDAPDHSYSSASANPSVSADRRTRLVHLRALLAPIHARGEDALAAPEWRGSKLKFAVQGTSVEVILAWLAAVHLPELEAVADA